MSDNTGVPEASVETTSVFRADLLKEMESGSQHDASPAGVEGLPEGSALLVVKRGPNAGSRFLLDQIRRPPRLAATPTATSSWMMSPFPAVTQSSAAMATSTRSSTSDP